MLSADIFFCLVSLVAIQRLIELYVSRKHEKQIRVAGGFEHGAGHFWAMKAIHVGWLVAMVLEVLWLKRPFFWPLALPSLGLFLLGQALRLLAMAYLKDRWTTRIMVLPGQMVVRSGIYRFIRHPNYCGVVIEIAFLPLIHSAYITAIIFSILNAVILWIRIKSEEEVLTKFCGFSLPEDRHGTI